MTQCLYVKIQIMQLKIFSDGGARGNPGPAAAAFIVLDNAGKEIFNNGEYLGETTNNVAEYKGVLLAYEWVDLFIKNNNVEQIIFHLDSELVVKQLTGIYKIKNSKLLKLANEIKTHERSLRLSVKYVHVRREENKEADRLVNEVLDSRKIAAS